MTADDMVLTVLLQCLADLAAGVIAAATAALLGVG